MATKNLGLVKAIIVSQIPPTYTEVVWAEQYDSNDLSKTRLKYYNENTSQWEDLAYVEDNIYSQYHSGTLNLFSDGNPYTQAIAILEEYGYQAYQSDYTNLSYDTQNDEVAWDFSNKKQANAYFLVDSDTSPNKLTFTLNLQNLIDGATGELIIEQTVDGTIEITCPSQSYFSGGDGDNVLQIFGASGERHVIGIKARPDGSGGFDKYFTLQESFTAV